MFYREVFSAFLNFLANVEDMKIEEEEKKEEQTDTNMPEASLEVSAVQETV